MESSVSTVEDPERTLNYVPAGSSPGLLGRRFGCWEFYLNAGVQALGIRVPDIVNVMLPLLKCSCSTGELRCTSTSFL